MLSLVKFFPFTYFSSLALFSLLFHCNRLCFYESTSWPASRVQLFKYVYIKKRTEMSFMMRMNMRDPVALSCGTSLETVQDDGKVCPTLTHLSAIG